MPILRTPDERFAQLTDYPFAPHYLTLSTGARMHYVEEGQNPNETVLMLHGEPTWSYLYRRMIPIVAAAGYRVIAPDLIGFGKSDKYANTSDYSYQSHVAWLTEFVEQLDLQNITLVCQDWGGLLGLRVAAEQAHRFKRITASNTFLPLPNPRPNEAFLAWQNYAKTSPTFNIGKIVSGGCVQKLTEEAIAAYDAPFPDDSYKAAARIFPSLVPTTDTDPANAANAAAWEVYHQWDKPFLTCFSDSDPITRGGDTYFQKVIPGTQGLPHITIAGAGHFVQEDKGETWAAAIIQLIQNT